MEMENDEAITTLNNPDDLGIYSNVDANTAKRIISREPIKKLAQKVDLVSKEAPIESNVVDDKKETASASKTISESNDKIFGMPKKVAYVSGIALVLVGGFFIYKKFIKK